MGIPPKLMGDPLGGTREWAQNQRHDAARAFDHDQFWISRLWP